MLIYSTNTDQLVGRAGKYFPTLETAYLTRTTYNNNLKFKINFLTTKATSLLKIISFVIIY